MVVPGNNTVIVSYHPQCLLLRSRERASIVIVHLRLLSSSRFLLLDLNGTVPR